ncbi:hypothetical protein HG531_006815 [Fusarium graminearum]|nr:hypothetical protein HG531_006815 [Fusarium graminearum]
MPFPLDVGKHLGSLLHLDLNLLESSHDLLLLVGDCLFLESKCSNGCLRLPFSSANLFIMEISKERKSVSYIVDDSSTLYFWESLAKGLEISHKEPKDVGSDAVPWHVLSSVGDLDSVSPLSDVIVHELDDLPEHKRIILISPFQNASFHFRGQNTKDWLGQDLGDFVL